MIQWTQLADSDLKDGQTALVTGFVNNEPASGRWYAYAMYSAPWQTWHDTDDGQELYPPTHYCLIQPPEESEAKNGNS